MRKRPVALAPTGLGLLLLCSSLKRFCSVVAIGLAVMLTDSGSSLADVGTPESRTLIACFHPEIKRFTGRAHPGRCNVAGHRGKRFVEVPVKGMKWGHWGANPTRAAFGVDVRAGTRIRVIAYRPITCNDGRAWYSMAAFLTWPEGNAFALRLPTCLAHR